MRRMTIGALSLSAAGLIAIASYEGFSDQAYIPVEGDVPTIGFGSTEGVQLGDKISVPEALERLRRDVGDAESAIGRCVKVPLSQGEYDAFASLAFNIGSNAFCTSTLVKRLNAGDYDGACEEIRRWVYAGGQKLEGLVNRREAEYQMCMEGKDVLRPR